MSQSRTNRHAFSLMELLVVIAIIGVLVGLLLAGIFGAFGKGKDTANKIDIGGLEAALGKFKDKYGFYPPSRIKLLRLRSSYGSPPNYNSPFDKDSVETLTRMFTRLDDSTGPWMTGGVLWLGATTPLDASPTTLSGDQCLVFFLGGIQDTNGTNRVCKGFSTNPKDPTNFASGDKIIFMEFPPTRLTGTGAGGYYSYLDQFGMPFAYFSCYNKPNGYNKYYATFSNSDCAGVYPYCNSWGPPVVYERPDTFQIISAGANKQFGPGCTPSSVTWTPKNTQAAATNNGKDDQSNFHPLKLGIAQ